VRAVRTLTVSSGERRELRRWLRVSATGARHRLRARIVLAAAERRTDREIARRLRVTPETVSRWRERFRMMGLDGLRREAPRAGASARVSRDLVEQVLTATVGRQSPGSVAWSTRSLARALKTNHMTVHRIWKRYGLANLGPAPPTHRSPLTRADLVGVYRSPGASAVVFGLESQGAGAPLPSTRESAGPRTPAPPGGTDLTSRVADFGIVLGMAEDPSDDDTTVGPTTSSLLVFLRAVEEQTPVPARLDAIFDRPLASLGDRVGAWLEHHPRYRVFTTEGGEAWRRSAEAWLRRWENVPLDPTSFGGIAAYREVFRGSVRSMARTESHPAWTLGRGLPPRRGRSALRSDSGPARRKTAPGDREPHA
jgi:transposase